MVVQGKKSDAIYLTSYGYGFIAVAKSKKDSNLWHQRLGHMNAKGLKIMHLNGKLTGLKSVEIDMCEKLYF